MDCDRCNRRSDRFSSDFGYICWHCLDALARRGVTTDIKEFMAETPNNSAHAEAYFNSVFSPVD